MNQRNENRPGHKKTKVGWIPEEWACLPFTKVFHRATKQVSVKPNDKYRQIGIRSHCKGVFFKDEVTGKALGEKRVFWCQPGALVFNIVFAWEQAVAVLGEETEGMIASHRFPMYRAKNGRANEAFYLWFFSSPRGKHGLTLASPGGAGRNKTLGQGELDFLFLPVPPLPEQERIAEVLGAWDRAIGLKDRLIEAKQRLKKGLMQQLLTGSLRFSQFGKPARKHGELPKGWKMSRIQDIARVNPSTEKPKHENCTVSFFSMADISEEGRIATEQKRPYLSVTNGFTSFQDGDILVAKITPCFQNGKGAHVKGLTNGIGYGSTEFHVVRPRKVDERFLFLHTQSRPFRARGEANMTGSAGQKRVPTDFIRKYPIPLPSDEEQRYISLTLSACDREIQLLIRKRDRLQEQKKGLMQRLLTGEVRLKVAKGGRK